MPTFNIHRADGSRSPTLVRNFLNKMYISVAEAARGSLILPDGTEWELIIENEAKAALVQSAYCIVSFQVHTTGNFAIARLYTPHKEDKARYEPPSLSKREKKMRLRFGRIV
jgi:hypothetical protein